MGVKQLREAFNDAAGGAFTCRVATLGYDRVDDVEWQILRFSGIAADGTPFLCSPSRLAAGEDPVLGARAAAQLLIDQGKL